MIKIVEITDENILNDILDKTLYGTLSLCSDNRPYSVPINYVKVNDEIYFHGSKKGKKMDFIKDNSFGSFSVVDDYGYIPSYFCNDKGDASPASHLFQSIIIDGSMVIVEEYDEKVNALQSLMEKYQPEGKHKHLSDKSFYEKIVNATQVFKLVPNEIKGKVKLGQNWKQEQFDRVIDHIEQRNSEDDKRLLLVMKELRQKVGK